MARDYRPNVRESAVISKLDHKKEAQRNRALSELRENHETMSDQIAMKLIEDKLVDTTSKSELENQIYHCLEELLSAEEFEINLATANIRTLVPRPHFVSLYLTAYIIEKLIDHKCIVDIYGTDLEIYSSVNKQVLRWVSL